MYYIGVEQVLSSAKLRTMKLYAELGKTDVEVSQKTCCRTPISEEELLLIDDAVEKICDFTETENSALYYICGYITFKENLERSSPLENTVSEFTEMVTRGRLAYPTQSLYNLGVLLLSLFKSTKPHCCNRFCEYSTILFDSYCATIQFDNPTHIFRRFGNCFFKGLVKATSDLHHNSGVSDMQKRAKLQRQVKK